MKRTTVAGTLAGFIVVAGLAGCSGPSQAEKEATALMAAQLSECRTSSDSLRAVAAKLEQERAALAARAADCDKQVADLRAQVAALTPPPAVKHTITDAHAAYQEALQTFRRKEYADAQAILQDILDAGAPKGLDDNCVYWIGECLYGEKKFSAAIEQFGKVFQFERSEKKDDAQFMIANSYLALGRKAEAKAEYERFARRFPASPYIDIVKAHLAKL